MPKRKPKHRVREPFYTVEIKIQFHETPKEVSNEKAQAILASVTSTDDQLTESSQIVSVGFSPTARTTTYSVVFISSDPKI